MLDHPVVLLNENAGAKRAPVNPLTLSFRDAELERAYTRENYRWLRTQSRVAIVVGLLIYFIYGFVDRTLVSEEHVTELWQLRGSAMAVALACFLYTWTPYFQRWHQMPMAISGLAAAGGMIAIQREVGLPLASHYLPGTLLALFWTYLFLGIRFSTGLLACAVITAAYNLSLVLTLDANGMTIFDHNFHLASANIIGAFSSYILEWQRRRLFFQRQELDRERREHARFALEDRLTGVPNRRYLDWALAQVIAETERLGRASAGLFIDLDNFKPINDRYGHEAGDCVLCTLSERIRGCIRGSDIIARIGGDEFFVILKHIDNRQATENAIRTIQEAVSQPIALPQHLQTRQSINVTVSVSIGAVLFPFDECAPKEIMRRADMAMYSIKQNAEEGFAFYESSRIDRDDSLNLS